MNDFYSYIYSLAVAAAAAGIVTALAPEGGQLKKYVKYIAALCVLIMLLLPARGAITGLSNTFGEAFDSLDIGAGTEETTDAESAVITQTADNIEAALASLLADKLGCGEQDVEVEIILDAGDISAVEITEVYVAVPEKYAAAGLELWISEQSGCAAGDVVIEWKSSES